MARPRVLLLITLAETGGAQQYVAALLPALAREYDVLVAAHGDGFLGDASRSAGVRYLSLRHVRRPLHPLRDLLGLVELYRLIRRERPAVVHANSSKAGILGRLAAVAARVPVRLFTVHGWAFKAHQGLAARLYLYADRAMRPLTTTTICVAHGEVEAGIRARTCRPDRTVMIHNGVELDRPQRAPGPPRTPVALLSVGRFRPPKDFTTLVHAMAALEPGTARLAIAGDGPDRQALEQEIANLHLGETVELLGTRNDVDQLLAAADIFVLSSDSEGLPMSVLEAMAAGLPVIATAVGGIPELVTDERTGVLVPPRDSRALAAAITAIARDPQLRDRLGAAARRRAETEFALETCRRRHLDLYRDLLRKRT
jgi:glycosyltransferase involved in cell wall biosynthesis